MSLRAKQTTSQVIQIPQWYESRKYDPLRSLTSELDWYLQFAIRRECRRLLDVSTDGFSHRLDPNSFAARLARQIETKPVIAVEDIFALEDADGLIQLRSIIEMYSGDAPTMTGVHATTLDEIHAIQATISDSMREQHSRYHDEIKKTLSECDELAIDPLLPEQLKIMQRCEDHDCTLYMRKYGPSVLGVDSASDLFGGTSYKAYFRYPIYNIQSAIPGDVLFTVRFDLPDELLVQQFKEALETTRRYLMKAGIDFSDRDKVFAKQRERWIDQFTLQIIDLQSWELSTGHKLSNAEFWSLVDKSWNSSDDSNLRKTYRTRAEEMLDLRSQDFRILQSRAAAVMALEMNERMSGREMMPENTPHRDDNTGKNNDEISSLVLR